MVNYTTKSMKEIDVYSSTRRIIFENLIVIFNCILCLFFLKFLLKESDNGRLIVLLLLTLLIFESKNKIGHTFK